VTLPEATPVHEAARLQDFDQARFEGILFASLFRPHLRWRLADSLFVVAFVGGLFGVAWAVLLITTAAVAGVVVWTSQRVAKHLKARPRRY
jgi:hypothetical protein